MRSCIVCGVPTVQRFCSKKCMTEYDKEDIAEKRNEIEREKKRKVMGL